MFVRPLKIHMYSKLWYMTCAHFITFLVSAHFQWHWNNKHSTTVAHMLHATALQWRSHFTQSSGPSLGRPSRGLRRTSQRQNMNRWCLLLAIQFSLEVDIEDWKEKKVPGCSRTFRILKLFRTSRTLPSFQHSRAPDHRHRQGDLGGFAPQSVRPTKTQRGKEFVIQHPTRYYIKGFKKLSVVYSIIHLASFSKSCALHTPIPRSASSGIVAITPII